MKKSYKLLIPLVIILFLILFFLLLLVHDYLNQMITIATAKDPLYYLFNKPDQTTIIHAYDELDNLGYGQSGVTYLFISLFKNTYFCCIMILICLIFLGFLFYLIHRQKFMNEDKEKTILAIQGQEDLENDIVYEVNKIKKEYEARIVSMSLDQQKQKQEYENMAHQIKSSLSTCFLNVDLLNDDEGNKGYIERIDHQLEKINKLTNDFLKGYSIRQNNLHYQFKFYNLESCIKQVVLDVQEQAYQKNIQFELNTKEFYLFMDPFWIQEALESILINCLEYAFENTKIYVDLKEEKNQAIIQIQDHGYSVDKQIDLFKRYETSNHNDNHYGIGLNMTKEIIEHHFGSIDVSSQENKTTFRIFLPVNKLERINI